MYPIHERAGVRPDSSVISGRPFCAESLSPCDLQGIQSLDNTHGETVGEVGA